MKDIIWIILSLLLPLLEELIQWLLGLQGDSSKVDAVTKAKVGVAITRMQRCCSLCYQVGIGPAPDTDEHKFKGVSNEV